MLIFEKERVYLLQEAEQALQQENEALARTLLEKKQVLNLQLDQKKEELLKTDKAVLRLREEYQFMNKELNEAKEKRDDLTRRGKNAHVEHKVNKVSNNN